MLYAPTSSGDFIFGHDGSNEPAINTTLRINPDNHDAIIVLTTGNPMLASSIGYEWTLWQTGSPDFLMIDKALSSAIIPLVLGLTLIAAIAATLHMRQRRVVRGRTKHSTPEIASFETTSPVFWWTVTQSGIHRAPRHRDWQELYRATDWCLPPFV
jgi:hypothetical protein